MLTLKEKLALPTPKWLIIALVALAIIGISKLVMWLVPVALTVVTKLVLWLAPIAWAIVAWLATNLWQALIWLAAAICAYVAFEWRCKKQRELYRDLRNGTAIISAEYEVV